jgi:hypothetical protein
MKQNYVLLVAKEMRISLRFLMRGKEIKGKRITIMTMAIMTN